ncbi:heavy-metal-associated domain-containing protein [Chitinophaga sp. CF418]|uniref:heavy-metal-associated domain-containing protein n=1 Tax=Chitinophaga sp. CF418 TaxID=1855287 RepID=UPI000921ED44|nr:heavy-metal-associated domain-containing protein [Chitinophaga sp. CF418]SHN29191.1 Copper chaperone CopZ [Chitinophaga sp. CF418]
METQQFKTNIKCSGCIATVTPYLNEVAGENAWKVDTAAPDKVLTISADKVAAEEIIQAVQKAGYKAEKL